MPGFAFERPDMAYPFAYTVSTITIVLGLESVVLTIRIAEDRGAANFGWLNSRHTFPSGQHYNPRHMGFDPLGVIRPGGVQRLSAGTSDAEILLFDMGEYNPQ
jgi:hypothetical protein